MSADSDWRAATFHVQFQAEIGFPVAPGAFGLGGRFEGMKILAVILA
jgi:hypothetical protein